MCFDQEKTQAPQTPFGREREMATKQILSEREDRLRRGIPLDQIQGGYASDSMPGRPMSDEEILAELFRYHQPTTETLPKFQAINQAAKNFAEIVLQNCPRGADRSIVLNCIRNARMFANAAVSLNGLSL